MKKKQKLYDFERRLTGTNTVKFMGISNIGIETFKGVYESSQDLLDEATSHFSLIYMKPPSADKKLNPITHKKLNMSQVQFGRFFAKDKQVKQILIRNPPVGFIKQENKLGFINSAFQLCNSVVVEPIGNPKEVLLVPCSSVYSLNQSVNGRQCFRQVYSLIFMYFQTPMKSLPRQRKYKNRGVIQIVEVEADWLKGDEKLTKATLAIVN